MDHHALEYYTPYSDIHPNGHFHRTIHLQNEPVLEWDEASELAPCLCKGWYELAKLKKRDRIDFTLAFWMSKLPYHPKFSSFLPRFFQSLDDIGVTLVQKTFESPFEAHLVYSLAGNNGFFRGFPPITQDSKNLLQKEFPESILPVDYLAFLEIHNGFAKLVDTGVIPSSKMKDIYDHFQIMVEEKGSLMTTENVFVNPKSLIPFYQSFDLPFFQCFWDEWHPDQEMGNVYYSSLSHFIRKSNHEEEKIETMSFETFIDWLMFYLEKIE